MNFVETIIFGTTFCKYENLPIVERIKKSVKSVNDFRYIDYAKYKEFSKDERDLLQEATTFDAGVEYFADYISKMNGAENHE